MNGVENDDTASFDARNNWWGSASGPSGQGFGTGDGVSTVVLFDPWLLCPFEEDTCTANEPPTAAFTATPSSTPGSLSAAFDGSASSDSDGTIADWSWSFGDSTFGDGETVNHTYSAPGTYTVTLTVTDDGGAFDSISHDVTVPAVPAMEPPVAAFTLTPSLNPATPLLVSVDGTASHEPDGTIVGYSWDFGDSTSGSGATTTHTYATGGTYTITLTVTDENGASDHVSHPVTVPVLFTLTVSTSGMGTVTSGTGGIVCPGTCSAAYSPGTVVALTDTPGAGQQFSGWTGACSGTGPCSVTMNAAMSVSATFSSTSGPPPPPPTPSASIGDVTHPEGLTGDTPFVFTVTLSGASSSTVTIGYATADGTASSTSDYAATSGTLTFVPGQTSATVTVAVHGDSTPENDETFTVNLSGATGATIADGQGLGTIQNDDLPTISVSDYSHLEGNTGKTAFTFTISLSAAAPFEVSVGYRTKNGTATAPSDYVGANGTAAFAPGQTTKTVTVQVIGDRTPEADETFSLVLGGASHATIADGTGIGTIKNDDPAADLSITKSASVKEPDAGETMTYTIEVSNLGPQAAAEPVVVDRLPAGVIFGSASSGCKEKGSPATVTCTLKPIADHGSVKLVLVVMPNIVGTVTNTVTVSSPTADPVPANNTFKLSTKVGAVVLVNPSGPFPCGIQGTAGSDTITSDAHAVKICTGAGDDRST